MRLFCFLHLQHIDWSRVGVSTVSLSLSDVAQSEVASVRQRLDRITSSSLVDIDELAVLLVEKWSAVPKIPKALLGMVCLLCTL
jgi:hypothetical protein